MVKGHLHDKGYKYLLSTKDVFRELLENYVDADWVHHIEPSSLVRVDKSYILPNFMKKEADLIYQAKFDGQDIFFYVLLELQSTVDFRMPYRLFTYMHCIWQELLKNTDPNETARKDYKLPSIVPIVLYNGTGNWTANRSFKDGLTCSGRFGNYQIDFQYILIQINDCTRDKLLKTRDLIDVVFFLDQATKPDEVELRLQVTVPIIDSFEKPRFDLFILWFRNAIILELPEPVQAEVHSILETSQPKEAGKMVSNISKAIRRGCEESLATGKIEGRREGIAEGMLKGKIEGKVETALKMLAKGFALDLVLEITGLSPEQLTETKKNEVETQ